MSGPRRKTKASTKGTSGAHQEIALSDDELASLQRFAGDVHAGLKISAGKAGVLLLDRMLRASNQSQKAEERWPNIFEVESNPPQWVLDHRVTGVSDRDEINKRAKKARSAFERMDVTGLLDAFFVALDRDWSLFNRVGFHKDHWIQLPRWAFDALLVLTIDQFRTWRVQKRGRFASAISRWEQDSIDFLRWRTVDFLRARGAKFTDDDVYRIAADQLARLHLRAGVSAIRQSYLRVNRRLRTDPDRYRMPEYVWSVIRAD